MKLLVVDGDADMVDMLANWLKTRGYEVRSALSAERFMAQWVEQRPDLVIVDLGLRGVDVLGLCRDLQRTHDALVLAIATEQDAGIQIRCLESGADAYLIKPFLPAQLLAHIHALSRRVRRTLLRNSSSILEIGPIRVDSLRHEVSVYGKVMRLTPTESKLLYLLAVNANDVCTLNQIVTYVWGHGTESDTTLIKAHIRHLREKIEPDPSRPQHIVTVAGSGYILMRQPDRGASPADAAESGASNELSRLSEGQAPRRIPNDARLLPLTGDGSPEYMIAAEMQDPDAVFDVTSYTTG